MAGLDAMIASLGQTSFFQTMSTKNEVEHENLRLENEVTSHYLHRVDFA